jgi:Mn-dependent DtxR family transcriptional regulator
MTSLSPSSQDYLEAILKLSNKENIIRSIDIAQMLGVSRASVNKAVGILKDQGYVTQQKYSYIELTDYGRKTAVSIRERHDTLKTFLIEILNVGAQTAEEDACKMEHAISSETFNKLKKYVKNSALKK